MSLDNEKAFTQAPERILPAQELAKIIEEKKNTGQKIVTTNGIFDFVHKGHAAYLEKARALGDMLIVAINSDASTKRIKGPERPINSEMDRAFILASLRCVDYVTIFEEDGSEHVLDILKPSIHTKGGDYDIEKMPETPTIRKNGGEVVIVPLVDGYSNSKQYKKIKSMTSTTGVRADHISTRD